MFPSARVAVFVDGCFWHGCREHGNLPNANRQWWKAKIAANRARDADTDRVLEELDWSSIRVWEHDDVVLAADRIEKLVRERRRRKD